MAEIANAYNQGGMFMHPILFISIFALAICVERVIFLFFKYNINGDAFMAQVQKLVLANNIDRAIKLCNANPNAALPKVIKAGLQKAGKSETEIQNAVEEATLEVVPDIIKRTTMLSHLASIATLMGLLGTIVGLIQAFDAVAKVAPDKRSEALTGSIAIAMNTTAFGLIVAIPALLGFAVLSGVTKKILDEIDEYSVKIENLLIARSKGIQ